LKEYKTKTLQSESFVSFFVLGSRKQETGNRKQETGNRK